MFEAPSQTGVSDGRDEPSASADDRGHDDPQSVAGDAAILPLCGLEVQPIFWSLARSARVEDVRAYLVHLTSKGFAWSSLNQTVCALRFFYGVTLGQTTIPERIAFAREPRKLPTVLSADEVVRFLEAVSSLKARVALTTAYAAGLRVSEVAALKVGDIDSGRMVLRIERGKGGKERYAMLSETLLGILRSYWRLAQPRPFLFPGRDGRHADRADRAARRLPIGDGRGGARQACERACAAAQFRDASPGERRRHSHHPGPARTREFVDDGALHARLDRSDRRHGQPAR